MALPESFFERDALTVARELIGCKLVRTTPEGILTGRIVETEAYLADDPASHSFRGRTTRNASMFGPPGHAYLYLIYGLHVCLNVVTGPDGRGEAVLLRALEPLNGTELMQRRRPSASAASLCNGPAKLVEAFGLSLAQDGISLTSGPLVLDPDESHEKREVGTSPRIGIMQAANLPYRFFLKGSPFLSRPGPA